MSSNIVTKTKKKDEESSSSDDDSSLSSDTSSSTSSDSDDDSSSSSSSSSDSSSSSSSSLKQDSAKTKKKDKKSKSDKKKKDSKKPSSSTTKAKKSAFSTITLNTSDLADMIRKFEPQIVTQPPPPPALPAAANQNNQLQQQPQQKDLALLEGYRQVHKNANLFFPKGLSWNVFDLVVKKLVRGKHRCVDLFLFASEMFYVSLAIAINEQKKKRTQEQLRNDGFRFKWMNSGPVAENFAVVCDQGKLLHSQLRHEMVAHGAAKDCPPLNVFMQQMLRYVHAGAQQKEEELSIKTYEIKLKDWEKGGTRYDTSGADANTKVSNIVFAAADVRSNKLQIYIDHRVKRSDEELERRKRGEGGGGGVVNGNNNNNNMMMMMMGPNNNNAAQTSNAKDNKKNDENLLLSLLPPSLLQASATKVIVGATGNNANNNNNNHNLLVPVPMTLNITTGSMTHNTPFNTNPSLATNKQLLLSQQQHHAASSSSSPLFVNAAASNPKYPTDTPIRIRIYQIIGGQNSSAFPPPLRDRLPEYVAYCQSAADPLFRVQLLGWIARSTRSVHQSFERLGGLTVARRWVDELLYQETPSQNNKTQQDAVVTSNQPQESQLRYHNNIHEATVKLPREAKESFVFQMFDRLRLFQCVCSEGTRITWWQPPHSHQENGNNAENNLNWLRKCLNLPTEPQQLQQIVQQQQQQQQNTTNNSIATKCITISDIEHMLTATAMDLLQAQQHGANNNNNNNNSSLFGIRRSATNQVVQNNIPQNSANNKVSMITSNNNNSNNNQQQQQTKSASAYRQHEAYTEQRLKMALELRLSVANSAKKLQQQQQAILNNSMLPGNNNNNTNAKPQQSVMDRFDEVFRPMPIASHSSSTNNGGSGNNIFAFLFSDVGNTTPNASGSSAISNAGIGGSVINIKSENFDPFKLLGMK